MTTKNQLCFRAQCLQRHYSSHIRKQNQLYLFFALSYLFFKSKTPNTILKGNLVITEAESYIISIETNDTIISIYRIPESHGPLHMDIYNTHNKGTHTSFISLKTQPSKFEYLKTYLYYV